MAQYSVEDRGSNGRIAMIYNYLMEYDGKELYKRYQMTYRDPTYNSLEIDIAYEQVMKAKGYPESGGGEVNSNINQKFEEEWND